MCPPTHLWYWAFCAFSCMPAHTIELVCVGCSSPVLLCGCIISLDLLVVLYTVAASWWCGFDCYVMWIYGFVSWRFIGWLGMPCPGIPPLQLHLGPPQEAIAFHGGGGYTACLLAVLCPVQAFLKLC